MLLTNKRSPEAKTVLTRLALDVESQSFESKLHYLRLQRMAAGEEEKYWTQQLVGHIALAEVGAARMRQTIESNRIVDFPGTSWS